MRRKKSLSLKGENSSKGKWSKKEKGFMESAYRRFSGYGAINSESVIKHTYTHTYTLWANVRFSLNCAGGICGQASNGPHRKML